MSVPVRFLLIFSIVIVAVSSAGILETLLSWELHETEGRSSTPQSKCLCQTSGCLCCVDLNLTTTIDLGGPACINIKQKEQNVSLNLSYGDNPVHNATIMIDRAANRPTCMNLLSDLAQLCAKFTSVVRSDQGHDACLVVEPALMRTAQATYNIGCFNFNHGVRQIELSTIAETEKPPAEEEEEEEEEGINTDELIAAVSASAEQGIALFSQWLGLNLNDKLNFTNNSGNNQGTQSSRTATESSTGNATSRMSRKIIDGERNDEKSDEKLKQLLSAQDNIMKESARIGQPNEAQTTFVYSTPIEQTPQKIDDSGRALPNIPIDGVTVLLRESQRGGRAYNIHQHVNEV